MKTKVALITGGYTGEAEISYKSSAFVYSQIDKEKYDVFLIDITPQSWGYIDQDNQKHEIDRQDFSLNINNEKIHFDVAFIILHGTPGEDGRLQGYFDMIGLPYTSCGALTSSLTMNKGYTKAIIQDIDQLNVAQSVLLFDIDRPKASEFVKNKLSLPLFVKPNAGGSSIGMNKVNTWEELPKALDDAYDAEGTGKQVLVEEFVKGREFSQGIYRDSKGELQVLPATEVITTREFFDFEAKYTPGLTQEITPAEINADQKNRADEIIKEIYIRLNCKGMVRVDFFLQNETDKFYFIEINTIPGQTPQSFIPQQVKASGRTATEFYGELIEAALIS
ncbi:D-alanine--D-alanine ligase [Sphingobacterium daejeonense]|uniref:D-alanine--D-alanine ligase n=1 Tax=Sphingobacterium daejeonense TaxID=371142 RepID=UPI0021A3086A|nr:D-alanine--D-alanine ligase [Sphingobacterium daejeonense]MCT1532368.1 D-alanine--D-alanine ligase [Sphingobacterium daejeonense]